ncbi:hypothetical protein [Diaminobutyricimonas sp. LJ205]|uniref:hypothetical protein n=1 Tax=Diaminobutyricimonas sp. LJ205 TaxID=2683590 RepID=UPI0012F51EBA|nr:hypothetical protein [Diaminobutyricimonas sp. LJ205]
MSDHRPAPEWLTRLQGAIAKNFPAAPEMQVVDQGVLRFYRWWSGEKRAIWIDVIDESNAHVFAAGGLEFEVDPSEVEELVLSIGRYGTLKRVCWVLPLLRGSNVNRGGVAAGSWQLRGLWVQRTWAGWGQSTALTDSSSH